MDFSERLRQKRLELKLTQQQLANLVGVTKPAVSQWEKGESRIKPEHLFKLAAILKEDPKVLLSGGVSSAGKKDNISLIARPVAWVPVITLSVSHDYKNKILESDGRLPMPKEAVVHEEMFFVSIEDDSMLPRYKPGDLLLIDPRKKPKPGDRVLAILPDGSNNIRRFMQPTLDTYLLSPLNELYASYLIEDKGREKIIGNVIGAWLDE